MMPDANLERNMATTFVRGNSCVGTLRFTGPNNGEAAKNPTVRLLCVPGFSRTGTDNRWPSAPSQLVINQLAVATPRVPPPPPPGVRAPTVAPILDIGAVVTPQNVITLTIPPRAPGAHEDDLKRFFVMAILVTRNADTNGAMGACIARHSLHPAFALFARLVHNELTRRTGRFLGIADGSLQAVKRAWRRLDITATAAIRLVTPALRPEGE